MNKSYASHLEVPVTDMEEAKKFYGNIFDWSEEGVMQRWDENYILVNLGENRTSFGLKKEEVKSKNQVVITMGVDDIDSKLKEVEKAGGKIITEKYEIAPEVGFAGNFEDPFGNEWGLHSPPVK